jgi:hypothetical protein
MPCFFHKWKVVSYQAVEIVRGTNPIPLEYETHVTMVCRRCGKPRLKILKGAWNPGGET